MVDRKPTFPECEPKHGLPPPQTTYNGSSRHVRWTKKSITYSLYDVDVFGKLDVDMKQISAEEIKRQSEEKHPQLRSTRTGAELCG